MSGPRSVSSWVVRKTLHTQRPPRGHNGTSASVNVRSPDHPPGTMDMPQHVKPAPKRSTRSAGVRSPGGPSFALIFHRRRRWRRDHAHESAGSRPPPPTPRLIANEQQPSERTNRRSRHWETRPSERHTAAAGLTECTTVTRLACWCNC